MVCATLSWCGMVAERVEGSEIEDVDEPRDFDAVTWWR